MKPISDLFKVLNEMDAKPLIDLLEKFGPITSLLLVAGGVLLAVLLLFQILKWVFSGPTHAERNKSEHEEDESDEESDESENEEYDFPSSDPAISRTVRRRIGEELELAVGGFLERKGWRVDYAGIKKGINDGGIDLIAKRDGMTSLIQCKFWKSYRIIYEKHIHQFHGAIETYRWDNPDEQVRGAFYTTARLSPEAKRAAQIHEIEVNERYRF